MINRRSSTVLLEHPRDLEGLRAKARPDQPCVAAPQQSPCAARGEATMLAIRPHGARLRVGWRQLVRTDYMAENWCDAIEIHPSQIRVGDIIGTRRPTESRLTVKMISGPQTGPRQWTFFSRDDNGQQRTSTFGEDELVRRYAKTP
jgi:hypothetical protein